MKVRGIIPLLAAVLVASATVSCSRGRYEPLPEPEQVRKVMIVYACGYNNLSSYIYEDILDLCSNLPPRKLDRFYKVLIFSHLTKERQTSFGPTRDDNDYLTPCSPVLIDAYRDEFGNAVMDTLRIYPDNMTSSSAEAVSEVLTYIRDRFPAKEYGLVISSHGTGWLPKGYYSTDDDDEREPIFLMSSTGMMSASGSARRVMPSSSYLNLPDGPAVKSMTAQYLGRSSRLESSEEIEVTDFVGALPMHLKYLVLDMCLMGGVELAYELTGKVDLVAFSQTEILAEGFRYDTMTGHLLYADEPDVAAVCDDYYHLYADKKSSATISLVDCNRLDNLTEICRDLFAKYSDRFDTIDRYDIQEYFRFDKHWFYDLRDILVKAGMTFEETKALDSAIAECVLYKAATPHFIGVEIRSHSGLSMYLPKSKYEYLNDFYKGFRWNKATSLVK